MAGFLRSLVILFSVILLAGIFWSVALWADEGQTTYLPVVHNQPCRFLMYDESLEYHSIEMNVLSVWKCYTAGAGRTIAIVDTGVEHQHSDLAPNLVAGYSAVDGSADVEQGEHPHGTHVAGIAAAAAMNGNSYGNVIGAAPQAKIMPIQVLGKDGRGTADQVAAGIRWAADHGANIINLSLGSKESSSAIQQAIDYAVSRNILVVVSAGNCGDPATYSRNGCSSLNQPNYPAAYPNVLTVAATNNDGLRTRASFSTVQSYVQLAAPGRSILSTVSAEHNYYGRSSGTSMAAPQVSGVAALIWSRNPSYTAEQIKAILIQTATDLGPTGRDLEFGYGFVNASAAISLVNPPVVPTSSLQPEVTYPAPALQEGTYVEGDVVVMLEEGVLINDILSTLGARAASITIAHDYGHGLYTLQVPVGEELAWIQQLSQQVAVVFAEPNYYYTIHDWLR